jgi:putative ABC transport system permease protein
MVGGLAGLGLAAWSLDVLVELGAQAIPRSTAIALDLRVLLFTMGLATAAGLVFGLLPAWQAARTDVGRGLAESGRGSSGGPARQRVRHLLVAAEVALSLVLLMGAALLGKSLWRLMQVDPGIETEHVLSVTLALPLARYPEGSQIPFYDRLYERVSALPGVRATGAINILPLSSGYSCDGFQIEGRLLPEGQNPCAEARSVSTRYFETMGIPVLSGRTFVAADSQTSPKVAVISRTMAQRHWPNEDPVGRRLIYGRGLDGNGVGARLIVGVVGDVRHFGPARAPVPEFYTPQSQQPSYHEMTLVVRAVGTLDPSALVAGIRGEVQALDPLIPLSAVQTLDALARASVAQPRFRTVLLSLFAALALVLALVGVYGVIAFAVSQRTQEIGIRMALGARARDVIALLLRQGMIPVLAGVAAGVAGALLLGRVLENLLYDVTPTDPLVLLLVPAVVSLAAASATFVPVRKAAGVDPVKAMRVE